MNMFAKFDEIPAMTLHLQDVKETKGYGRKDARMDNVKTVYPPFRVKPCVCTIPRDVTE